MTVFCVKCLLFFPYFPSFRVTVQFWCFGAVRFELGWLLIYYISLLLFSLHSVVCLFDLCSCFLFCILLCAACLVFHVLCHMFNNNLWNILCIWNSMCSVQSVGISWWPFPFILTVFSLSFEPLAAPSRSGNSARLRLCCRFLFVPIYDVDAGYDLRTDDRPTDQPLLLCRSVVSGVAIYRSPVLLSDPLSLSLCLVRLTVRRLPVERHC